MIKIKPLTSDEFHKVKETLTRIGIANNKTKVLYQSCHVLQKGGEYFIAHFKELLALDGNSSNLTFEDLQRTESITNLLVQWGLVKVEDDVVLASAKTFRVIKFQEKHNWNLVPKYTVGV